MLYDMYGRELKPAKPKDLDEDISGPSIGSVRQPHSQYSAIGLTPAKLGQLLRAAEQGDAEAYLEIAEQMEEKDLHYAAVLGVRKRAIRRLKLQVNAASDDQRDQDAADLVRRELSRTPVRLNLINMMDALGKGFSVCELFWDTKTIPWTIKRVKYRLPKWFEFDREDGETLRIRDAAGARDMPQFKFVTHLAQVKSGLPIRGGLAWLVAWAYIFKNYSTKDWQIFMEAYGHPLRLGRYSKNAAPEDRQTLLKAVRRIGTDMAAIIPKEMDVDIVNGNVTNAGALFEGAARWWDEQISKAVLGQVSTTDAIAGGHAVGKVHNEVRDDIRDADAEQLAATLQRDIATPITYLNFGPDTGVPETEFVAEEDIAPDLFMQAVTTFGELGMAVPVSACRERFNIPAPADGEEVLQFERAAPAPQPEERFKASQHQHQPDAIDRLASRMATGQAAFATDPFLGGILEAMSRATSLDEARDILGQLADTAPPEALQKLITELTFAARLTGDLGFKID